MKKQAFVLTLGVVLLSVVAGLGILINAQGPMSSSGEGRGRSQGRGVGKGNGDAQVATIQAGDYRLSGPYTHKNLTIFLVHGKNVFEGKTFITLQEAMTQKKVVVYE